jgi:hypothetical protein
VIGLWGRHDLSSAGRNKFRARNLPGRSTGVFSNWQKRLHHGVRYRLPLRYYEKLEPPIKKFYWVENEGHNKCYEDNKKYVKILIEEILPGK